MPTDKSVDRINSGKYFLPFESTVSLVFEPSELKLCICFDSCGISLNNNEKTCPLKLESL